MMFANATNFYRKSGAAQWRDLCVDIPSWKCFSTERSAVEKSAVLFRDCAEATNEKPHSLGMGLSGFVMSTD